MARTRAADFDDKRRSILDTAAAVFATLGMERTAGTKFPGITIFPFTITSGGTAGTGVATLKVTTPKGVQTIAQFQVHSP